MKTKKIFFLGIVILVGLFLAACTNNDGKQLLSDSPIQNEGIMAYIDPNTPSERIITPDKPQSFDITFYRQNDEGAASFNLNVTDSDGIFSVPAVSFAAGKKTTTITVAFNMPIGTKSNLTLLIPDDDHYYYGQQGLTIQVNRDYTWQNAGMVTYTSDWAGTTVDSLLIEHAKERNDLYRILSPYYYLEPDRCPNQGYHIQFTLDDNYNAVSVITSNIGEVAKDWYGNHLGGDWWLWCDSNDTKYGALCTFTNDSNSYDIEGWWAYGSSVDSLTPYYLASEQFVWTTGYPGAK